MTQPVGVVRIDDDAKAVGTGWVVTGEWMIVASFASLRWTAAPGGHRGLARKPRRRFPKGGELCCAPGVH